MNIYIVATLKNNKNKMIGFTLIDLDDNNKMITVTKEQLINVLSRKTLKINNAKLSNNSIQGTYHSLEILPSNIDNSGKILRNISVQVLYTTSMGKARVVIVDKYGDMRATEINKSDLLRALEKKIVVNVDNYGNLLCKKITISEKIDIEKKNSIYDLDRRALDESAVWTISDFVKYMNAKGWSYKILSNNDSVTGDTEYQLSDISDECNIIHIPVGVTTVENMFIGKPKSKIHKIIISHTVHTIKNLIANYKEGLGMVDVGDIIFQPSAYRRYATSTMSALQLLNIFGKITFPNNTRNTCLIYSYCNIHSNIRIESNGNIKDSFKGTRFVQNDIDINCEKIIASFENICGLHEIRFGNRISKITGSFRLMDVEHIDFDNAISLEHISTSFNNLNIEKVDMSKCKNLIELNHRAFDNNSKLCEVVLSNSIENISNEVFGLTNIKYIRMPEKILNLSHVGFNKDTKIEFPSNITELNSKNLFGYKGGEIISEGNSIKLLGSNCFDDTTTIEGEYKLPKSIEKFEDEAFRESRLTIFDSGRYKGLREIPTKCFMKCSRLKTVIIDDNIQSINGQSFKYCGGLEVIVIGPNVKNIASTAFSGCEFHKIPICYVVNGSKAHKVMSKLNVVIVEVTSVQEARDIIFNSRKTEKDKEAKFMLLNDTKYANLLQEPYIKDVGFSYKFVSNMQGNDVRIGEDLVLDKSKYVNLDLFKIDNIKCYFTNYNIPAIVDENDEIHECNKFIAFSNLLTRLFDMPSELNTEEKLDNMISKASSVAITSIYTHKNKRIVRLALIKVEDEMFKDSSSRFDIILTMIVIGMRIKFITVFDSKIYEDIASNNDCIIGKNNIASEHRFNLGAYLGVGDNINYDRVLINNALIHPEYVGEIMNHFKQSFICLWSICVDSKNRLYKAIMYDLNNQNFLEVMYGLNIPYCTIVDNVNVNIQTLIKTLAVTGKYSFDEIDNIVGMDRFKQVHYGSDCLEAVKLYGTSIEERKSLINNISNYDIEGNKEIQRIADIIYKDNIRKVEDLSIELLKYIINCDIMMYTDYTLKEISEDKRFIVDEIIQLDKDTTLLVYNTKINVSCKFYLIALVSPTTHMKEKGLIKLSILSLKEIITSLFIVGMCRAKKDIEPLCKISNKRININNFICLRAIHSDEYSSDGIKLLLAMDKINCDMYILGEWLDTDFYALLRFKETALAFEYFIKILKNSGVTHRKECVRAVKDIIEHNTNYSLNSVTLCRYEIMSGVPNNYSFKSISMELFNILAKQPR